MAELACVALVVSSALELLTLVDVGSPVKVSLLDVAGVGVEGAVGVVSGSGSGVGVGSDLWCDPLGAICAIYTAGPEKVSDAVT